MEELFNKFFPTVNACLSCEDVARQSCAMVRWWIIFGDSFLRPVFKRAACSTFQTCVLKIRTNGHAMCGSMVDIQCASAEIRRGKKTEEDR